MKMRLTWFLVLMLALSVFMGCSDDDDPVVPAPTAFEVMASAGAAYINDSADCPGVISADALFALLDDADEGPLWTVIDIRNETYFDLGHIEGAVRSSLGTLIADLDSGLIPENDNYVIACYSGQSAGHAKIAMELLGYENVKTLLWGMTGWNTLYLDGTDTAFDKWTGKCATNIADADADVVNNNGDLTEHVMPVLTESASTVVADRVADMLENGFKGISYTDLQALPAEDYIVVNYFGEADYMGTGDAGVPGHIDGAFQFTPYESMGISQMLKNLPSDGTLIVVYCWTGQHSSQVTAYLNMLGYNAKSLSNGSNNLFYDSLTAHKWSVAQHRAHPVVATPVPAMAY
jgi:rhodanese-related sulfurtransferase